MSKTEGQMHAVGREMEGRRGRLRACMHGRGKVQQQLWESC